MSKCVNERKERTIEERIINTTNGPRPIPKGTVERVVNTSDILEPEPAGTMVYEDEEPEILQVLSAGDWAAVLEGDGGTRVIPLAAWVVVGDEMYGVAPPKRRGKHQPLARCQ